MPPTATDPEVLVIHPAGALGDFVLTWPLLRTLSAAGRRVGVVAAASKALLARSVLGVRAFPDHLPPWTGLWAGSTAAAPMPGVGRVIAFGDRPAAWHAAAAALCPHATVVVEPRALDRRLALELARREGPGPIHGPAAAAADGPVVLHAGAGGEPKRWSLGAWLALADGLRGGVELAAGETELERWPGADRAAFERAGGRFLPDLGAFADLLARARAAVAADTGPGHLAAQLGIPTLSLFGPTDPECWAPIGARTAVLRAPNSRMADLTPDQVRAALDGLLATPAEPTTP